MKKYFFGSLLFSVVWGLLTLTTSAGSAFMQTLLIAAFAGTVSFLWVKDKAWYASNVMLLASVVLMVLAEIAYIFGWSFTSWVLIIAGIICFIRYSCRWGNWCDDAGPWWKNTAWPAIKLGWRTVWTWRIHVRRGVLAAAKVVGPFVAKNILPIAVLIFALVTWWQYNDAKSLADQTWKFWVPAGLWFIVFLAWSKFSCGIIAGFIRLCAKAVASISTSIWERFQKEVPAGWKAVVYIAVGTVLTSTSSLIHGKFIRGQGWLHQLFETHMQHQTWSGIAFVLGVAAFAFCVATIIAPRLFGDPQKKDKKKLSKEEVRIQKKKDKAIEKAIRDAGGEEAVIAFRKAKKA